MSDATMARIAEELTRDKAPSQDEAEHIATSMTEDQARKLLMRYTNAFIQWRAGKASVKEFNLAAKEIIAHMVTIN